MYQICDPFGEWKSKELYQSLENLNFLKYNKFPLQNFQIYYDWKENYPIQNIFYPVDLIQIYNEETLNYDCEHIVSEFDFEGLEEKYQLDCDNKV